MRTLGRPGTPADPRSRQNHRSTVTIIVYHSDGMPSIKKLFDLEMSRGRFLLLVSIPLLIALAYILWTSRPRGRFRPQPSEVTTGLKADPSDGRGWAEVRPADPIRVMQWGTWTITYVADLTGIATGGGILFQVSPFWGWSQPQPSDPDYPGYTTVRSSDREVKFELQGSNLHWLLIRVSEGKLSAGDSVLITYGDTGNGAHMGGSAQADRYAERGEEFLIKVDGNGDGFYVPIKEQPTVDILAAKATQIVVQAPSMVEAGKLFEVKVTGLDPLGNWDRSFRGRLILDGGEGVAIPEEWEILPSDSGLAAIEAHCTTVGRHLIHVMTPDGRMTASSGPVLCLSKAPRYHLYWGDLQGHSGLSDGSGTPGEYFGYARYVSGMDVSALTDHDAHGLLPLDEHPETWRRIVSTADSCYEPGAFVTFVAYEWTSWTYGHRHVLFPGNDGEVYSFRDSSSDTPAELGKRLQPWGAIAIPHHPAGGPIAVDWDHHDDRYEPLVEICSVHGNSDSPGCPLEIYHPVKGAFVTDALKRGYRLGIVASGDTHNGHPGRKGVEYPAMGLAGIWATTLTREGIWEALLSKRTYGTSGERIVMWFKAGGHWMGESIPVAGPRDMEFEISVFGTSEIRQVEVLENESVIRTFHPGGEDATIRFKVHVSPPSFYRVRVIQEDGGMAWSSPIWIDSKDPS